MSQIDNYDGRVVRDEDTLLVDLWYPPYPSDPEPRQNPKYIEIDLMSVRAADGIRVHYDFDRDGFVIEQPVWGLHTGMIEAWREVHFCESWKFDNRPTAG